MNTNTDKTDELTLEAIKTIISTYSADEYAQQCIEKEKASSILSTINTATNQIVDIEVSYYEYMKQTWSGKDNPTLEECIQASYSSKLEYYAQAVLMYVGFLKNGKVFVLDKEDKVIYFIYKKEQPHGTALSWTNLFIHYDPLGKDIIEESVQTERLFSEHEKGRYDFSCDQKRLINELDELIAS